MQLVDYRVEFTKWWTTDFKTIKFPTAGTVFDYYIDPETKKFEPWTKKVPKFEFDPELPLQVSDTFDSCWHLSSRDLNSCSICKELAFTNFSKVDHILCIYHS